MTDPRNDVPSHSPRGMWRASSLRDGYPVVELIDSKGRKVADVALFRGIDPSKVRRFFNDILESSDPSQPRLRLVTKKPKP